MDSRVPSDSILSEKSWNQNNVFIFMLLIQSITDLVLSVSDTR